MNRPFEFDQIDRYLSGESPPDEHERIRRRAAEDPRFRQLLEAMQSALRASAQGWDTEHAWQRLAEQRQREPAEPVAAPARWQWRWPRPALAVAALLVVGLGIGLFPLLRRDGPAESGTQAKQEHRAAPAQTRLITLADSSRVILAPASVLRVPESFPATARDVELEGEAFFEVVADSARPFIVLTRNARTRVLGTSFLVSEFADDRAAEVVVLTGRVEFGSRRIGESSVLAQGQAGRVSEDGALVVRSDVDTAERVAWMKGRLVFRDISFTQAVPVLERWYGVEIEISDERLARARLTAFFERQTLEEVLDLLAETMGARYQRTGNHITYAPK